MNNSLKDIKEFIIHYFLSNDSGLRKVGSRGKGDAYLFNKDIYELELLIQTIKEKEKIGISLNPKIHSNSILKSIDHSSIDQYFKPVDLQFNFLYHIAVNYNVDLELRDYIDLFLNDFSNQLTFGDIKITDSGATRIVTNLRFAVNDLRNLGMLLRQNERGKRILLPSAFGLFVLLYIINNQEQVSKWSFFKPFNQLRSIDFGYYGAGFEYDNLLIRVIEEFGKIDIAETIDSLKLRDLSVKTRKGMELIIMQYAEHLVGVLEVYPDSIRVKKGNQGRMKQFIKRVEADGFVPDAHEKLLRMIKELKRPDNAH